MDSSKCNHNIAICINFVLFAVLVLIQGCTSSDDPPVGDNNNSTTPADTYFSLAVTENSHNHAGGKLLFLDFQEDRVNTAVIRNNVVISPKIANQSITLDGDDADWTFTSFSVVKGLPQNNYPLSEFIDAVPTDINVGSAWDNNYIYLIVQWQDAGHTQSTQYNKWIYGDQGGGETGWNPKNHVGTSSGAPNENAVNATHVLSGSESEDRVLIMFPINDSQNNFSADGLGCAAYCHANLSADNPLQNYTGTGVAAMHTNVENDTADIWHWKAARTAASGFADDKHLIYAEGSENGRMPDSGNAAYISNALDNGNPGFMHSSGLAYAGDNLSVSDAIAFSGTPIPGTTIPSAISQIPSSSRADVEAVADYDDTTHAWTVEFRRLRNTGNNDDRQFVSGTDAVAPPLEAISSPNAATGATLFSNYCENCHGFTGVGMKAGDTWSRPRIQRASGSLILKALQTVGVMSGLSASLGSNQQEIEQAAEDIAAYLQTQETFELSHALSVDIVGASGTVTSDPLGIDCADGSGCSADFIQNADITLSAGYVAGFNYDWSGVSCTEGVQNGATCTVSMTADQNVTMTYTATAVSFTLTVNNGANGTVTVTPQGGSGITCNPGANCSYDFSENVQLTLTVSPETGYQLQNWSGDCSGTGSCAVLMDNDRSVTVLYESSPGAQACSVQGTPPAIPDISMQQITNGLSFPVHVTNADDNSGRLFIVEQRGTIRVYENGGLQNSNFLDIQDRVSFNQNGENGLLSVAFHPDFNNNGLFYVNYVSASSEANNKCTNDGLCTIVSEFTVGGTGTLEESERIVLEIVQPYGNHNGGQIAFGPEANPYLYIGMGDGGDGNDPGLHGQNLGTLLGAMLRIDIDNKDQGLEYAIPADNPEWNGTPDARREIWAYGLRNPWRFSFDPQTENLYAGDVGQEAREEIDIIQKGLNYGWRVVEGDICNPNVSDPCTLGDYEPPIMTHSRGDGWYSITGGMVYRGSQIQDLCGVYLYGDYLAGTVRGLRYDAGSKSVIEERTLTSLSNLSSFGYDENYEVYALNRNSGILYKIVSP